MSAIARAAIAVTLFLSTHALADVVTEWNQVATDATYALGSAGQARVLATAHGAMFDAANAIEPRYKPYLKQFNAPKGASMDAAAAAAMHGVLVSMQPAQKAAYDNALNASLAKVSDAAARDAGVTFGREVAEAYVAERSKDGMSGKAEHTPGSGPGRWRPTPPANAAMAAPHLGNVVPFTSKDFSYLTLKGPPALDSDAYARDVDEIRRVGARNSKERTAEQTASAIFWYINTPVPWESAARTAVLQSKNGVVDNARVFALMNMAGADAYFACWQLKRKFEFWRPVTAIREAAKGADASWEPLLVTPPHQDYPSGHNVNSGAMAQALRRLIGRDDVAFSANLPLPPLSLPRSWKSISEGERDVMGARIWAGIHFRSADEHGLEYGHAIGDYAVDNVMRPL